MSEVEQDLILVQFAGTYRAPHPDGIRDANVTREFDVVVKMERSCLDAPGLKGFFQNFYKERLRQAYPDMIDTYRFEMIEATELDGSPIDDPKALKYEGLLAYIKKKKYPINTALYSPGRLRNEVVAYEKDPVGQQKLEAVLQKRKGNSIAMSNRLSSIEDVLVRKDAPAKAADKSVDSLLKKKQPQTVGG